MVAKNQRDDASRRDGQAQRALDRIMLPISLRLSPREVRVVRLVAEGKANKEIATVLNLSEGSVKQYLHTAMRKLRFSNRTEVAMWLVKALG